MAELRRTPMYDRHVAAGARMRGFAGWEMPVEYRGILEEARSVRERAGLFDVSHMGEVEVFGPDAEGFLRHLLANDVGRLEPGRMLYTVMCTESGGVVDDLMVLRRGPDSYLLVVNAATTESDLEWIRGHAAGFSRCRVRDRSADCALLALQGPGAERILEGLVEESMDRMDGMEEMDEMDAGGTLQPAAEKSPGGLGYLAHRTMRLRGVSVLVSRSGYTGEDGFEIMSEAGDAGAIWDCLREAGAEPAGLGARDTLRLEAGYRLYGSDMDRCTSPFEAGLGWTVKLGADRDFIGAAALREQKARGTGRRLVGMVARAKGIPRAHQRILRGNREIGVVTSGSFSPTRREGIALGYVAAEFREPGTQVEIESQHRRLPAEVVTLPFVASRVRAVGRHD